MKSTPTRCTLWSSGCPSIGCESAFELNAFWAAGRPRPRARTSIRETDGEKVDGWVQMGQQARGSGCPF